MRFVRLPNELFVQVYTGLNQCAGSEEDDQRQRWGLQHWSVR